MTESTKNNEMLRKGINLTPKEVEARLAGIIDSAMDAIISIDEEQHILLFNESAEKMFGYESQEIIGQPLSVLIPERYRAVHHHHVGNFGETGSTNRAMGQLGKLYGRRSSGGEFPIEASISKIDTEGGKIFTVILRDISVRVNTDNALLEKERILNETVQEKARLFEQTEKRLQFLSSLRTIDLAISSTIDLRIILNILLDQVMGQLEVDAVAILLFNPTSQHLEYADGRGHRTNRFPTLVDADDQGYASAAAELRATTVVEQGIETEAIKIDPDLRREEGIVTCFATPLVAKGEVEGVLEVFFRRSWAADAEWIDKLEALAGQAAIAIESVILFDKIQRTNQQLMQSYNATIEGWSQALDLRDHETQGHTERVTETTMKLAESTGQFSSEDLLNIRWGALLHDIGKMGVPDHILLKTEELTEDEWVIMKKHPEYAYRLLNKIAYLRKSLDIPRYHHEWWDGKGYPYGIIGDHIPLSARLFSIVDVWDALRFDRPYRPAWPNEKALTYIEEKAGTQFDPEAVQAFLAIL